ncbi:helix-turn-helix domain-containing protein [candidate division WOR-3 bacterium]|nr:helix-turn-helix domain-containing protein [candidate division WOR-3 bacterium]
MKLLNVAQLSEFLNIKKKTIYDWCHKQQIPFIKVGGLLRFDHDDIMRWLQSKKRKPRRAFEIQ